jgi:hypothetical protein
MKLLDMVDIGGGIMGKIWEKIEDVGKWKYRH